MNENRPEKNDLETGQQKLAEALHALPRVEAPKDFEMKVKARIAEEGTARAPRSFGIPRFAFALVALIVVAGVAFLIVSRDGGGEVAQRADLEQSVPPIASQDPVTPSAGNVANASDAARVEGNTLANAGGEVREEAVKPVQSVNIGATEQPVAGQNGATVGVAEALSSMGADVVFEDGAWLIKSVSSAGRASSSGLKAGDALFAVDGITLSRDARLQSPFSGRMFLVKRPGNEKLLPIPIK